MAICPFKTANRVAGVPLVEDDLVGIEAGDTAQRQHFRHLLGIEFPEQPVAPQHRRNIHRRVHPSVQAQFRAGLAVIATPARSV